MSFQHKPVLLEEVIENLNIKPDGIYIDGTLGGGGHSKEILKKLNKDGLLIGIDQDKEALEAAKNNLKDYKDQVIFVNDNYSNLENILKENNIKKVDGILLDIGVSSHQVDTQERGFSYHNDGPLDMRMNREANISAYDIVNNYSQNELSEIIYKYGEEKWAKRISEFIVKGRKIKPIETTLELVEILKKAIPSGARRDKHPGIKTFQAIRIEVNKELDVLENIIPKAINSLKPGGRLCIISFHSLEDRIVKEAFNYAFSTCICPDELPICVCDKEREIKIITRRPIEASEIEKKENSRARSSKLRVCEKL